MRFRTAFLTSLAFLFASVANVHAHVHLCLDGQEPPTTVHVDDGDHLGHHLEQSGTHDDVDVDVPAELLAKTLQLPVCIALSGWDFPATPAAEANPLPESRIDFRPSPPPFWRPPLRAPPR